MTNKQISTINLINKTFKNPGIVTRAQILELVNAGAIKWPYWITDHKHGYAVETGKYTVPTATEPTVKAPKANPSKLSYAVKSVVIPGKFKSPEAALEAFVAARKKAKKGFSTFTINDVQAVPANV